MKTGKLLPAIGPGLLVAATGVGAGDLAAASLTGAELGLVVLWAVVVGSFLKFVLNEGLTRWQLATGSTLIEGCVAHLGRPVRWIFLVYLVIWSFLVAAALMSAIGVTAHAIYPLAEPGPDAARTDKVLYGIAHSLVAVTLIRLGGYKLFEKVMAACIALMFVVVVWTAVAMQPPLAEFLGGLLVPTVPRGGVAWTVALMGGIGGSVTVLCYGYWIREEGRHGMADLAGCRVDLAVGYAMTAVFGLAMVVIGSSLGAMEGGGATLMVRIADQLEQTFGNFGPVAKWAFLAGAWGAVFSSMLGVWQSVPYLFADLWQLMGRGASKPQPLPPIDTGSRPYRPTLYILGTVPIAGLFAANFQTVLKTYAVTGALFIPMLAAVLIALGSRPQWIGREHQNKLATTLVLVGALALFLCAGVLEIRDNFFPVPD